MNKNKLNPACVFEQFAKINTIPRPSKHEEKMIAFLKEFGESRGLETIVDETGNVLIRKNATPGYENRETIILQSLYIPFPFPFLYIDLQNLKFWKLIYSLIKLK